MNEHKRVYAHLYDYVMNDLPDRERQETERHLASCDECRKEVRQLSTFLTNLDHSIVDWSAKQSPEYWNEFAQSVDDAVAGNEQRESLLRRYLDWFDSFLSFRPRDIVIASAVCTVVLVGLIVGKGFWETRKQQKTVPATLAQQTVTAVDSEALQLHEYFRKSRTLFVSLANLKTDENKSIDLGIESEMSRTLLRQARLIKQRPLDSRSIRLVVDMEKIFIKMANSDEGFSSPDFELIRNGIERENLLYKVRRAEATYNPQYAMLVNDKDR